MDRNNKPYRISRANDNEMTQQRRAYPRRDHDICMVNVDGKPCPVLDWSQSGVLFETDTRAFEQGQTVNMILRFKLDNMVEDVKVTGEIVRKNTRALAVSFTETPKPTMQTFEKIIAQSA
jgi:hypothetical protein